MMKIPLEALTGMAKYICTISSTTSEMITYFGESGTIQAISRMTKTFIITSVEISLNPFSQGHSRLIWGDICSQGLNRLRNLDLL